MSRPARRPSRIRPPHRGRTPSVSSANRPTREVQPFLRPVPPRTRSITLPCSKPPKSSLPVGLVLAILAILIALVYVQMNSNLIPH